MSRYVQFITPDNIEVSYELAGAGTRFLAALIDHAIQAVALAVLWTAGLLVAGLLGVAVNALSAWAVAALLVASFVVTFGYFAAFEMLWGGHSPGKRYVGLRVVRDGGYPIDPFAAVVRNVVRIIDLLPPLYGAGVASIFLSAEYKRLGDWAAGTLVIKERTGGAYGARGTGPASPMVAHFMPLVRNVDALRPEQYATIRRFTERRHELEIPVQAHIALRLARPLLADLGLEDVPVSAQWHYADLLEAVARVYSRERGLLAGPVDAFGAAAQTGRRP